MFRVRRRSVRFCLLILTLVAGFALHGVQAAHMKAATVSAPMGMSASTAMPDGCDDCDGCANGPGARSCPLICCGFVAVVPSAAAPQVVAVALAYAVEDVRAVGLLGHPDPFPPKFLVRA